MKFWKREKIFILFFFLHHLGKSTGHSITLISSPKQHQKINTRSDWLLLLRWRIVNYLVWLWDLVLYVHVYTHLYSTSSKSALVLKIIWQSSSTSHKQRLPVWRQTPGGECVELQPRKEFEHVFFSPHSPSCFLGTDCCWRWTYCSCREVSLKLKSADFRTVTSTPWKLQVTSSLNYLESDRCSTLTIFKSY